MATDSEPVKLNKGEQNVDRCIFGIDVTSATQALTFAEIVFLNYSLATFGKQIDGEFVIMALAVILTAIAVYGVSERRAGVVLLHWVFSEMVYAYNVAYEMKDIARVGTSVTWAVTLTTICVVMQYCMYVEYRAYIALGGRPVTQIFSPRPLEAKKVN